MGVDPAGLFGRLKERKRERQMQIEIIYTCGECGEYLSDIHVEHEVCPNCADHCTVVREEIVASPVCGA